MAEHPNVAIVRNAYESHILRLRDGKVVDLWDLPEDIQAHDNFFDGK